jgi:hypothetical protein
MASVLNRFTTTSANVTTSTTTVYTTPASYTTVVLLGQISNISGNIITISASYVPASNPTVPFSLVAGAQVPVNDSINVLSGKLVLLPGDSLTVSASANGSAQVLLSLLETLNQ